MFRQKEGDRMNKTISFRKSGRQPSLALFMDFLKKEWPVLALASLLLAGFAVVRTYSASFISDIVEHLQERVPLSETVRLAFLGAASVCSCYVMRYAGSMLCVMLSEKLALLSGRKRLIWDEAFASLDVERRQRLLTVLEKRRFDQLILMVTYERGLKNLGEGMISFDLKEINRKNPGLMAEQG